MGIVKPKRGRGPLEACRAFYAARRPLVTAVLAALVVCAGAEVAAAERSAPEGRRLFLVLVDRVSLEELARLGGPNLQRLLSEGAVGLMSTRTGGRRSPESCYVTLGAGARAVAGEEAFPAFEASARIEEGLASDAYLARTGKRAPLGSVVHLGVAKLAAGNLEGPYRAVPGSLGSALREAGLATGVVGNADLPREFKRHCVCVVMDRGGVVDLGYVGRDLLAADPAVPSGTSLDVGKVLGAVARVAARADLVAVETGDTSRVEDLAEVVDPAVLVGHKRRALARVDALVGGLMARMDPGDRLLLLSPCPSVAAMERGDYLTPVAEWGGGIGPSLLTSASTRRPGLVLNTDVAPTVLEFFGVSVPGGGSVSGMPMTAVSCASPPHVEALAAMSRRISAGYIARAGVLEGFVTSQALLAVACGVIIAWGRGRVVRLISAARRVLLLVAAFPAAFLLQAALVTTFSRADGGGVVGTIVLSTGLAVLVALASTGLGRLLAARARGSPRGLALAVVALVTWGLLAVDLLSGCPMQRWSVLSYSPVIAARFYGIGNEYMGVMVSAAAAGAALLADSLDGSRRRRLVLVAATGGFFAVTAGLIAVPWWGANFGGAATAVSCLGLTMVARMRSGGRVRAGDLACVLGLAGAGAVALILLDASRGVDLASHMGRAVLAAWSGGARGMVSMASRKLTANVKLIAYTMWTRPLIAFLVVIPYLFYRPVGLLAEVFRRHPWFSAAAFGCAVGAVVAFVANDSGVVAAATTSLFSAFGVLTLMLDAL